MGLPWVGLRPCPLFKRMVQDILLNDSDDLSIVDGDFNVGESNEQHAILIVNTAPGSWKQFPVVGVGIGAFIGSSGQTATIKRRINVQMEKDGYTNVQVSIVEDGNSFNYYLSANRNE